MKINDIKQIHRLIPRDFIPRTLIDQLMVDIYKPEMQIIYGPRQVGKSSLIYVIMEKLFKKKSGDLFYYNLDIPESAFESPQLFLADIKSQRQSDHTTYVFIDEIQRKHDIGLFLKYIYDQRLNIKFILTGSSSLNIKNMVKEPLTGRKYEYLLSPVTMKELLLWQGIIPEKLDINTPRVTDILHEYMLYGGYPSVLTALTRENKTKKLEEIAGSYIRRDLSDVFGITNTGELYTCSVYLAENIGNLLSRENIAKTIGMSTYATTNYIEALEKSFIISLVPPYYKNPVKEISHRPKVYFLDNGIRNAILKKLSARLIAGDFGKLFEQTVYITLYTRHNYDIRYWRNINQTEIDFIAKTPSGLEVYEAKLRWDKVTKPRNVLSFEKIYNNIITKSEIIDTKKFFTLLI